jgi:hypothetical protein
MFIEKVQNKIYICSYKYTGKKGNETQSEALKNVYESQTNSPVNNDQTILFHPCLREICFVAIQKGVSSATYWPSAFHFCVIILYKYSVSSIFNELLEIEDLDK